MLTERDDLGTIEEIKQAVLGEAALMGEELVGLVAEAKVCYINSLEKGYADRAGSCRKVIETATGCMVGLLEAVDMFDRPPPPFTSGYLSVEPIGDEPSLTVGDDRPVEVPEEEPQQ